MNRDSRWSLGAKLTAVTMPFLLLGFLAISQTLWVSWQLEGGAAAVNEAGRMRMQVYRIALARTTPDQAAVAANVAEFERSLLLLRDGDPERPLFVPWDDAVTAGFGDINASWLRFREAAMHDGQAGDEMLVGSTVKFVEQIDQWVVAIERHLSRWTALLHLLQMAMMALTVLGASTLVYTGYLFVLEPVGLLKQAFERIERGDRINAPYFSNRQNKSGGQDDK